MCKAELLIQPPLLALSNRLSHGVCGFGDAGARALIVLVRDPRDVIVSSYYERTERGALWNYAYPPPFASAEPSTASLSAYVREPIGSFATLIAHHNALAQLIRAATATSAPAMALRYEDLQSCPEQQLFRLLQALTPLSLPLLRTVSARAVERCRFQRMQTEADHSSQPALAPASSNPTSRKVRLGMVGGYRLEPGLSASDIAYMEQAMHGSLDPLWGYRPLSPVSNRIP